MFKKLLAPVLIAVVSMPLAMVVTLLTFPFWRWFEETTGIEAYGHSGPAEWCYLLLYGLFVVIFSVFWYLSGRNKYHGMEQGKD